MLNQINIAGRLTRDPELRKTPNGVPVATFTLAVERDQKDKTTGERATDFIDVVAWRQTAEFASKYFAKGRMAIVSGRLQFRDFTDRNGAARRATEVLASGIYFGGDKPSDSGAQRERSYAEAPMYEVTEDDGELPF